MKTDQGDLPNVVSEEKKKSIKKIQWSQTCLQSSNTNWMGQKKGNNLDNGQTS